MADNVKVTRNDDGTLDVIGTVATTDVEDFFINLANGMTPEQFAARFEGAAIRLNTAVLDATNHGDITTATTAVLRSEDSPDVTVKATDLADVLAELACANHHLMRLTGLPFNPVLPIVLAASEATTEQNVITNALTNSTTNTTLA